ncbi:inorganic diphosphatase [Blautia marasmi]|uniref:inorganic diphosphatase n=1 Tax=Blautia marasmi TaxID=1917868 RepID=UPI0035131B2D
MWEEWIGREVTVVMDRPLGTRHPVHGFMYPLNYGYIPNTVSDDNEELDAYVLGVDYSLETFTGKVIAIIHRLNDQDDKLIVVAANEVCLYSDEKIRELTKFQEQFFDSIIIR